MRKQSYSRKGLSKLTMTIVLALVLVLLLSAIGFVVLKSGNSQVATLEIKANRINTAVLSHIESNDVEKTLIDDDNTNCDDLLVEYLNIEHDRVSIDIPKDISIYLDNKVVDYIKDLENQSTKLLQQLKQDLYLVNIDNTYNIGTIDSSKIETKYIVDLETKWVIYTIDVAFVLVNGSLWALKAIPFVGKSLFVKAIKEAVPAALWTIAKIITVLDAFLSGVEKILKSQSDNTLLSWFSVGGVVGNILDIIDNGGYDGRIRF
ncbi:MAG: hypothetical protein FWF56_06975 [Firmicutes bacterium]|nr:hypothetical protein [Bacillota bacterium]